MVVNPPLRKDVLVMSDRDVNIRKGFNVEIFSVLWMVVEAVVAIGAGILAHSLARWLYLA